MDILEKIVQHKKSEVAQKKLLFSTTKLEKSQFFDRQPLSFRDFLTASDKSGIIAEFKRKSPSKGIINAQVLPEEVGIGYEEAGVSAISVLTDTTFFGGENRDLTAIRNFVNVPILRKDFIIDEYQILEAKAIGADVILLIAACLEKQQLSQLAKFAKSLDMSILTEVHSAEELDKVASETDAIGVNNRNLKTFEVNIENSIQLSSLISDKFVKISESGISQSSTVKELQKFGFQGFLMGENFMKTSNPTETCQNFIQELQS